MYVGNAQQNAVVCVSCVQSLKRYGVHTCQHMQVLRGLRGGVQDVAIKVLTDSAARDTQRDLLIKEIQMLKDLRDRNVVQFYGAALREGEVMLVTEYMPGGMRERIE